MLVTMASACRSRRVGPASSPGTRPAAWARPVLLWTGVALLGLWVRYATSVVERLGAALAVGGGLGNLADRLFRPPGGLHGAVIDWIHVSFYAPTFNLADVWLRGAS